MVGHICRMDIGEADLCLGMCLVIQEILEDQQDERRSDM